MRIWPTKRWWKRLGLLFVGLLAVALVANSFMAWRTESRLQAMIATIRAAGEPASIAELAPKPIPDAENAAAILAKLGPQLDNFSKDNWRFSDKSPVGIAYEKRTGRGEAATQEQMDAIRGILNKYPDLDAGLAAAAACDKYASVTDFSVDHVKLLQEILDKPMNRIRSSARFLNWRMEALTAEGKHDKAVELGIEMLKLGRLYDHEPLMVNMLVAAAVRGISVDPLYDALAAGPVSPQMHAALDHELALHDDPQRIVHTLKTERAYSIEAAQTIPIVDPEPPTWVFRMFGWPVKRMFIGALNLYDGELTLAASQGIKAQNKAHEASQMGKGHGVLAELMMPGLEAAFIADARCTAQLRALRIFNAMRQFAEKNGREAANLDELGLPTGAMIDPFSGESLKLKHTDDGWIIYTVMSNGIDDGGNFDQLKDFGVGPPRARVVSHEEESSEEPTSDENASNDKEAAPIQ